MKGQLWIVAAPSGGGKTSLIAEVVQTLDHVIESISYTTRPARPREVDGVHYFFTDQAHFAQMIAANEMLEYAAVYHHFYGTSLRKVDEWLAAGNDVILNIDWQGARQVMDRRPDTRGIFLLPPSIDALRARLTARGQDNLAVVDKRMTEAGEQISHYREFEFVIVNDDFQHAAAQLRAIISSARLSHARHGEDLQPLVEKLLSEANHFSRSDS